MKIFLCIVTKILYTTMVMVSVLLPFSIFLGKITWYSIIPFVLLLGVSYGLIGFSYKIILSTNNPADRKNFFSINRRYQSTMKGSVSEMGSAGIVLQDATNEEIVSNRKKIRKKKLQKLSKIK